MITYWTVRCPSTGLVLGDQVRVAHRPWQRFWGLMGTSQLPSGQGMLFPKTNAVHAFFMRYPIRLAYLDKEGVVLAVRVLNPWHIGPIVKKARYVLELPDNPSTRILNPGDRLTWEVSEDLMQDS